MSNIVSGSYFGEISESEMLYALRLARDKNYRNALDFVIGKHPDLDDYLLSNSRVDWLFHCYNKNFSKRCLDLGSGWGTLSFQLASFFKDTISVERVPLRLDFQVTRARQDRITNASFIASDILRLPLRQNQFDLIVANGVLEWAALFQSGNPRDIQLEFLKELLNLLRPGGCLYVGIENRFGLQSWLGRPDHPGLPFTSLLPRSLADFLVSRLLRERGWSRYYTYTYSWLGYKRLLRQAGFSEVEIYWVYPSYSYPKFSAKVDNGESYSFLASHYHANYPEFSPITRGATRAISMLPPTILKHIFPIVWPQFLIFAWKGFTPESVETAIENNLKIPLVRRGGSDVSSSTVSFVGLKKGRVQFFSKVHKSLRREPLGAREKLTSRHAAFKLRSISTGQGAFFVETPIKGRACNYRSVADNEASVRWLLQFQDSTTSKLITSNQMRTERLGIGRALSELSAGRPMVDATLIQLEKLADLLIANGVNGCAEHGDFSPGNILVSTNSAISVLDWEFYRANGNPVFDFCFFVIQNCLREREKLRKVRDVDKAFSMSLSGRSHYSPILRKVVLMFCGHRGLPLEAVLLGIPYALSRCVTRFSVFSDMCSPIYHQYLSLLKDWNRAIRHSDFNWLRDEVGAM